MYIKKQSIYEISKMAEQDGVIATQMQCGACHSSVLSIRWKIPKEMYGLWHKCPKCGIESKVDLDKKEIIYRCDSEQMTRLQDLIEESWDWVPDE